MTPIWVSVSGVGVALNFAFAGRISARRAFVSALEDVRRAIPDAGLIEASPDPGRPRQKMRKLMTS